MLQTVRTVAAGLLLLAVPLLSTTAAGADETPAQQAERIFQAAGVQGGLIVHLGCGDGRLTAALYAGDRYLVHGLDADPENVRQARENIESLGLYGPVSVDTFDGKRLPYADNLVNLVVADDLDGVPMKEVMRVLAPLGTVCLKKGDAWAATVKPWPDELDQWTHFLYDASGNAVSKDRRVGPPKRLQWEAAPRWCRSHEFPTSVQAVVCAGGRVLTILDEAPSGVYKKLPQRCSLVARDAANGLLLWKQPMKAWDYEHGTGLGDRWHIHHTLPRRLVAEGDRVYVTLRFHDSPVSVLDAATGEILTEALDGTQGTDEMLLADGVLVVKTTDRSPGAERMLTPADLNDRLAAVDVATGRLLWQKDQVRVAPYALAMQDGKLVYHNLAELVCLDAATGRELWRTAHDVGRIPGAGSTLLVSDGVVLYHGFRRESRPGSGRKGRRTVATLTAFSAEDGHELWSGKGGIGWAGACTEPTDLFVAGGLVWCGQSREGRDVFTGEVKKTLELGQLVSPGHHPRCHRSKATEEFLIWPKRGAEFVDLEGDGHMRNDWLRAPCFTGLVPAAGLVIVPPSQCFCYPGVKLSGYLGLAAGGDEGRGAGDEADEAPHLERGPAYSTPATRHSPPAASSADWPMYRHDPERSGATSAAVPPELTRLWEVTLSCQAAQPVIADGRVFIAEKDAQRIRCLDATDGRPVWTFIAGGRIDSPPTVYDGRVLFGCCDGWVYCLDAANGELAWRFRAAPQERLVMSFGRLESAWPVHGSVLVEEGTVYFAAGRSSFLDGGIGVFGLDAATGELRCQAKLEGPWPDVATDTGTPFAMEGAKSDLLVSDGESLYMERIKFDRRLQRQETPQLTSLGDLDMGGRHLLATGGFLDDSGFDRLFWMYTSRWPGFYFSQQAPKSGQLVVFDDRAAYSVKYFYRRQGLSPAFIPAEDGYLLFADDADNDPILVGQNGQPAAVEWLPVSARTGGRYDIKNKAVGMEKGVGYTRAKPARWQQLVPVRARAMVLAGDTLFLAGPLDVLPEAEPDAALAGRRGAELWAVSAADGTKLAEYDLKTPPVLDGMSAAGGKLYVATADGKVVCLGNAKGNP